jgi:hypothetical protein
MAAEKSVAEPVAGEKKETPFLILVSTNAAVAKKSERNTIRRFNLVYVVTDTQGVWSQIEEMLKLAGEDKRALSFTVLGMVGVRTKEELLELSKHGEVEWCPGWGADYVDDLLGIPAAAALIQSARRLELPGIKISDTIG